MSNQFDRYRSAPVGTIPTAGPQQRIATPQVRSGASRNYYAPYTGTPEEATGGGLMKAAGGTLATFALMETVVRETDEIANEVHSLGDPDSRRAREFDFDSVVADTPRAPFGNQVSGDTWESAPGNYPYRPGDERRALNPGPQQNWDFAERKQLEAGPRVHAPEPMRAIGPTGRPSGKKPLMLNAGPREQFGGVGSDLAEAAQLSGGKIVGRTRPDFAEPSRERSTKRKAGGNIAGVLTRRAYG